ncbi:MAG: hypothetical protein Q8L35_07490 [Actinomycetota bacterium]|nr:hypothetical protein [Actinomycetota bacterium]
MVAIARKNLSVLLILVIEGFAAGLYQQATAFINGRLRERAAVLAKDPVCGMVVPQEKADLIAAPADIS